MKERPILFSAPMVRALLNCTKSQTRRVVKDKYIDAAPPVHFFKYLRENCPYGQPGDRLWVREAHSIRVMPSAQAPDGLVWYRESDIGRQWDGEVRWKPSIHMPRWASRILLEIVSVRVERLQEITNDDAKAEGPEYAHPHRHGTEGMEWEPSPGEIVRDPYAARHNTGWNDCWICAYRQIWQDINGPGSWSANPWVWVVEFKRVTS